MAAPTARDRGVALLVVVAVLAVLSVLAAQVIGLARDDLLQVRRAGAALQAEAALEGAMWLAAGRLLDGGAAAQALLSVRGQVVTVGTQAVAVRIASESGKLDLDAADETALAALLRLAGAGSDQATALAAAIADWRDADDLVRNGGAERRHYAAAGLAGLPPNRPFVDVTEVRGVLGMTPSLAACLLPELTLHSGLLAPDPAMADAVVRRALGLGEAERGPPPLPVAGDAVAIETRIAYPDGTIRFARRWILRLTGNMAEPLRILERRDIGPMEAAADAACPPGLRGRPVPPAPGAR